METKCPADIDADYATSPKLRENGAKTVAFPGKKDTNNSLPDSALSVHVTEAADNSQTYGQSQDRHDSSGQISTAWDPDAGPRGSTYNGRKFSYQMSQTGEAGREEQAGRCWAKSESDLTSLKGHGSAGWHVSKMTGDGFSATCMGDKLLTERIALDNTISMRRRASERAACPVNVHLLASI